MIKKTKKAKSHPLLCWDAITIQRALERLRREFEPLYELQSQYQWDVRLEGLLSRSFDAVVVTEVDQTIRWVSRGFKKMTGYSPAFAIGKKPNFLQGTETSAETRQKMRLQIAKAKPVCAILVNYRHDGTPYECKVEVFPLFDEKKNLRHFIALEQEIPKQ